MAEYIKHEYLHKEFDCLSVEVGGDVYIRVKDMIDYMQSIPVVDMPDAPQWISVEDRLPDAFVSVLGYMTDAGEFPAVRECYRISDAEFYFPALFERHPVSHWMPMPDAPEERRELQ